MPAGRNNKYNSHVKPRLETIRAWRRRGLTDKEICENLGVGISNFSRYKNQHGELKEVLKYGKAEADAQVESALFKRAMGYEYEEVRTYIGNTGAGKGKAKVEKTMRQVEPNVAAQIFYLKNRCYDRWQDRRGQELSGPEGKPLNMGNVLVVLGEEGMDEIDKVIEEEQNAKKK